MDSLDFGRLESLRPINHPARVLAKISQESLECNKIKRYA
jgi:hypothetical protein